uniref:Uncharacterized protein n=1 Tax=Euplotes crassus TaxID=5936 RepID=A0A7S3KCS0_EUPCR|mmetsp:Transcript_17910/g.17650  ORF Transcript_17910/g.17650 Transcript_17910/m.17650 type:complete len:101 (+) Transcript_17910:43-345(+)
MRNKLSDHKRENSVPKNYKSLSDSSQAREKSKFLPLTAESLMRYIRTISNRKDLYQNLNDNFKRKYEESKTMEIFKDIFQEYPTSANRREADPIQEIIEK